MYGSARIRRRRSGAANQSTSTQYWAERANSRENAPVDAHHASEYTRQRSVVALKYTNDSNTRITLECAGRAGRDRPSAGFEWLVAKKEVQGRLPLPLLGLVSVDARGVAYFEK